jgi:CRP-like cAMP-binding protein
MSIPQNHLLDSLSPSDRALIPSRLKVVELTQETVLFEVGSEIDKVYFPHSGVVSLVVPLASGEMIETAMVGRDGLIGGASALGTRVSVFKAIVQIAGSASVLDADRLSSAANKSATLRATLFRHEQVILAQAQQSAACNASHSVEARLSRWLLRARDLQGSDDLNLTQEFLSQMLGVRRSSVSVVAHALQELGLIRYSRGHIRILDLAGLQAAACECYESVRAQAERLMGTKARPSPRNVKRGARIDAAGE